MFTRPWIYLLNPFQSVTKGNFLLAFTLSTYLDAALNAAKSDAAILLFYNFYHPIHVAYINAYNLWLTLGGTQKGSTLSLKNVLGGLTAKLYVWDLAVQTVYAKGTPQYVAIFPDGHKPFLRGKQSVRISYVKALENSLIGITALAITKTDVGNYATLLDSVNTTQKGNKSVTNTNSDLVEAQRIIMCNAQMYCYGGLVQKFSNSLDRVGEFFDLEIMRSGNQSFFIHTVNAHKTVNIFKRTLAEDTVIKINNTGTENLKFFLSNKKSGLPETTFVLVPASVITNIPITQLGDPATMHFLNVSNEADNASACEVRIL